MPSTDSPGSIWLKSTATVVGEHTGVPVVVGVAVNVAVALPVGVAVKVGVTLPVGVPVPVAVKVGVALPVGVAVFVAVCEPVAVGVAVDVDVVVVERLRKITIVCEIAVPSTILTVATPRLRSLLINRSAGMV